MNFQEITTFKTLTEISRGRSVWSCRQLVCHNGRRPPFYLITSHPPGRHKWWSTQASCPTTVPRGYPEVVSSEAVAILGTNARLPAAFQLFQSPPCSRSLRCSVGLLGPRPSSLPPAVPPLPQRVAL